MSQSHPNPRDGDGGCHPHLSCHPGCGEPGSFAHTRVCKKRCTLTQRGRGSAGIYFFFPAGISQRGERPASSPSVPAPAGKQPRKGWHRAERGRMGSPRRSARVEQQGLTRGGAPRLPRAPEWHPGAILGAGRTQSHGEGGSAGGGSASVRPEPAPLRTPGAHEASPPLLSATPHHHPRGPRVGGGRPPPHTFSLSWLCPGWTNPAKTRDKIQAPRHQLPMAGGGCGGAVAGTPRQNGTEGLSLVAFCPFPARWRRGNSGGAAPRSQSPPGGTGPRVNRVRPGAAAAQSAPALGGGRFLRVLGCFFVCLFFF